VEQLSRVFPVSQSPALLEETLCSTALNFTEHHPANAWRKYLQKPSEGDR